MSLLWLLLLWLSSSSLSLPTFLLLFQNLINKTHYVLLSWSKYRIASTNSSLLVYTHTCTFNKARILSSTSPLWETLSKHTARSKNNHQQTNTECTTHCFFFVFASAPQRDGSMLTGLGLLFPSSSSEFLFPLSHFLFTAQNSHFLSAAILLCAFALDRRPLWLFAFLAILDF